MKPNHLIPCLLLLFLPITTSAQENYLRTEYDKFDDRTIVMLWQMPLAQGSIGALPSAYGTKHNELRLTLTHFHSGRTNPRPPDDTNQAYLSLSAETSLGLVGPPRLTLLIDEERYQIQTEWPDRGNRGHDAKWVNIPLSYQMLRKLTAAKAVEGRLGITEFHLVKWHQEEIKRFLLMVVADSRQ